MSTAPTPTPSINRCFNFDVVIEVPARSPLTTVSPPAEIKVSSTETNNDDDNDELSDAEVARLLRDAEERMRYGNTSFLLSKPVESIASIKLPKLAPGLSLPQRPITSQGAVSRISDRSMLVGDDDRMLADGTLNRRATTGPSKKSKDAVAATAGPKWFDLPRTDLTMTARRDMQTIKARNVLDPHRHYKKDNSGLPEFSQMGTIIEGNTEFLSSRIVKRERKQTIVDEILADGTSKDRFKRKYLELQKRKKSGKKEFYRKLKEQRKKFVFQ